MSLLDTLSSVLLVHAHPDDETITTGALAAELVARGIRVYLLTATRGERGEVVAGPLFALAGTDALSLERERELDRAASALGLTERFWLGEAPARAAGRTPRHYGDSGMTWIRPGLAGPALDVDAAALVRAPHAEVAADVTALLSHLTPSLVISYDNGGGYGHPDHVRVHEITLAATRRTGTPFAEIVSDPGAADEWFTLDRHLGTVTAALRCHASQLTVQGAHIVHSGGQREEITASVGLRTP
ncbi:PIG-L deacetylase family protein [Cryobacterium psychrophilum]|uniref:GlcNAc-PI de-N-acetylase n=1 Tax=Cryobacterium psychrophilum TaxID=41988 RepID=A0A4Y8KHY3_9MICO|nr:PIG-L family deacetylase [Cryobacterium psychrophilum]TDW29218.1 N-acetyl-1-D-myo-inositol-2-amino-2-deoxy-alpha-D-glucopyranoside deacetylase [Cryobacterium psychrophilum]TFD74663.1 GlcNAc-PI de-N-acetylase [Cryobacterium psychrophilum]